MTDEAEAEARVIAELAVNASGHEELDPHVLYSVVLPNGDSQRVLDLEKYQAWPDRVRGTTTLHDADSFIRVTAEHEVDATKVYASLDAVRIVAVFNGARGRLASEGTVSGWGDHRAVLTLRHTPEWEHWAGHDGKLLTQTAFAEHIEDGLLEIVDPAAAEMLELAQTFHAHTGVNFKTSQLLDSGERQLLYEETVTAKAGRTGQITVPKEFVLGIRPFEGSEAYRVVARLRHRASEGVLHLGYRLDRPHDVLRTAFDDTLAKIDEAVASDVLRGTPPEGVGR